MELGREARINSPVRLVQPMTLVGFTALSEEIMTKWLHPAFSLTRSSAKSPKMLLRIAAVTFTSITPTCL